jgi:SAM-dependent MidA family methyltransferase
VGEAVSWRTAMAEALYGRAGFFTQPSAVDNHFRTSAHSSPLFATAVMRLVVAADEALQRPEPLDIVDIGAGSGNLLRRLAAMAPTYLARRLRLTAVELAPRPPDLPEGIGWYNRPPSPSSVVGILIATEWLDNVPLDIAEFDSDGRLRYVLVDPSNGAEVPGTEITQSDSQWVYRWWDQTPRTAGVRVEVGASRDEAWAAAVARVNRGFAITVDYGHLRYARPQAGTLTGFHGGRSVPPVPDGSCDITAHVAIDAACAAGQSVAGVHPLLTTQRQALQALGMVSERPPVALAETDPKGYVQALAAATEASDLMNPNGLGGHFWVLQPVGLPGEALPPGLRP